MVSKILNELLDKLDLSEFHSDKAFATQLKSDIRQQLETQLAEHDVLQKTLDLGFQEMQKMLELIEQRDLLTKSIFDASKDIILTLDQNGQVIEFNHACEVLLKIEGASILGKLFSSVIPISPFTNDLLQFFSNSSIEFDPKMGTTYETMILDAEEKELAVMVSVKRIQLREHIIYTLYIKDLSLEKAAMKAIEESRLQLVLTSKMSALGEMAGGVAHEINTPLAIIQMRADYLIQCVQDKSLDDETLVGALQAIDATVKRIAKIVAGLRSFARDGRQDPMTTTSIARVVDDTFSLCKEKFSSHGVQLDYIAIEDVKIQCRPVEITQVLLNLLNNSYDAIQTIETKWVKIELTKNDHSISLSVSDSGTGIPEEIQKKMMQPFFTTKEIGKGTGLGLSISRGIIESHHGQIEIDNSSAHTCIKITLPLHPEEIINVA